MDLKRYRVFVDELEEGEDGVEFISMVENPAIQRNFITLSEEKDVHQFCLKNEEKQYVVGAALVPNLDIYRTKPDRYIYFEASDIEKIRNKFFLTSGKLRVTNLHHTDELIGGYINESWIKDSSTDKSKGYGFSDEEYPVGTWFVSYHVPDKQQWEKHILSGAVKGFSIEGILQQVETKLQDEAPVILTDEEELASIINRIKEGMGDEPN